MFLRRIRRAAPWLALAGCFLALCVFMWRNITDLLDSDMASDMIYANLLARERSFLSENWYYSTEIRIFTNHLSFAPLFLLTQDWFLVRVLGSALTYALLVLSVYALLRAAGLRRRFPPVAAALLLPLSELYFHFTLVGTFYTYNLILTFLLLALALAQSAPCPPRARALRLAALLALSVTAGLGGYRFLYLFSLPLAAAALYLRLRHGPVPRVSRLLGGAMLSLGAALLGAALNRLVLANRYVFSSYDSMAFLNFSFDRVTDFLSFLPTLLGFPTGQPILSVYAAPAALSLLLLALAGWSVAAALRAPRGAVEDVSPAPDAPHSAPGNPPAFGEQVLALFAGFALAFYLALLALTDVETYQYHFLPLAALCVPLAAFRLDRLPASGPLLPAGPAAAAGAPRRSGPRLSPRAAGAGLLACLLAVTSAVNYRYYSRLDNTYEQRMLLNTLAEEGYDTGYASFWLGNVLTELSGGEVEMYLLDRPFASADILISGVSGWLQERSHLERRPEGKVFILFSKYYHETDYPLFANLDPSRAIYESPYLIALGYESFDDLYSDAAS